MGLCLHARSSVKNQEIYWSSHRLLEVAKFSSLLATVSLWLQLPENVNISKEARTAIGKAASVFVLYATSWYVLTLHLYFSQSPWLHICIQLFRQRLSHKSVKAHAIMQIGIMGRKSSAFVNWGWRCLPTREGINSFVYAVSLHVTKTPKASIKDDDPHYP